MSVKLLPLLDNLQQLQISKFVRNNVDDPLKRIFFDMEPCNEPPFFTAKIYYSLFNAQFYPEGLKTYTCTRNIYKQRTQVK
jgi:hypothetical protein